MVWLVCRKRPFWVPPPKKFSDFSLASVWTVPFLSRSRDADSETTTRSPDLILILPVALSRITVAFPPVISIVSPLSATVALGLL